MFRVSVQSWGGNGAWVSGLRSYGVGEGVAEGVGEIHWRVEMSNVKITGGVTSRVVNVITGQTTWTG